MNIAWWIAVGALVALAGSLFAYDRSNDSGFWFTIISIAGITLFCFVIAGLVLSLGRHYGRIACGTFATQTHRQTRFVVYTSWSTGDCLTPDGSGHWIPTKNLREFGSKP